MREGGVGRYRGNTHICVIVAYNITTLIPGDGLVDVDCFLDDSLVEVLVGVRVSARLVTSDGDDNR